MAIQGPLRELGIHDVFQLLDLSRKTGVLRVTSELRQNEGTIWFDAGAVVAATVRSNPHPLGDILLRSGKITEADLLRAVAMQREHGGRLGDHLVAMGALTRRELQQQVRAQVEEVVFAVLGWSEGYFVFEDGPAADAPGEAGVRITTEALLMEGARRIDEWSRIQDRVPHLGVVPRLVPALPGDPGLLQLTPFEWRVLAACDGVLDVRAIARTLGSPDFDVARTVYGLAAAAVIAVDDPAVRTAAAAPRQDPLALLAQGETFLRRGDPAAARTLAAAVLSGFPEDSRGHLLLGRACLADGAYAEAEAALREAHRLAPADAVTLRLLALARLGQGRHADALAALEEWRAVPGRAAEEDRQLAAVGRWMDAARTLAEALRAAR